MSSSDRELCSYIHTHGGSVCHWSVLKGFQPSQHKTPSVNLNSEFDIECKIANEIFRSYIHITKRTTCINIVSFPLIKQDGIFSTPGVDGQVYILHLDDKNQFQFHWVVISQPSAIYTDVFARKLLIRMLGNSPVYILPRQQKINLLWKCVLLIILVI